MKYLQKFKKLTLSMVLAFMFITGCEELNVLNSISFPYEVSKNFTIPEEITMGSKNKIFDKKIKSNLKEKYQVKEITENQVQSIKIKSLNLEIIEPEEHSFQFIKEISATIQADTLPEIRLAFNDQVAKDVGGTLDLETTDENLMDYIQGDQYHIKLKATTRENLEQDLKVNGNIKFLVKAKTANNK